MFYCVWIFIVSCQFLNYQIVTFTLKSLRRNYVFFILCWAHFLPLEIFNLGTLTFLSLNYYHSFQHWSSLNVLVNSHNWLDTFPKCLPSICLPLPWLIWSPPSVPRFASTQLKHGLNTSSNLRRLKTFAFKKKREKQRCHKNVLLEIDSKRARLCPKSYKQYRKTFLLIKFYML